MALRAMTVSLPVEMGCAEHEFNPKFNAKNSMTERTALPSPEM